MKTLQEQRTESVLNMQERITELEKENTKLKGLVNQYKASKCGRISLVNRNMIMFDQFTKAKEIIRDLINLTEPTSTEEVQHWNETFRKAEQFLKDCEVE